MSDDVCLHENRCQRAKRVRVIATARLRRVFASRSSFAGSVERCTLSVQRRLIAVVLFKAGVQIWLLVPQCLRRSAGMYGEVEMRLGLVSRRRNRAGLPGVV